MNRDSGMTRAVPRGLLTGALVLTLCTSAAALAQDATPGDDAAVSRGAQAGTAPDQPRRGRDRRRSSQTTDEPAAAATAAAAVAPAADTTPATLAQHSVDTIEARMVCKNIKATGTKISRRICGTPEQWATQERTTTDNAQEAMRQVRERSSIVVSQPQNPLGGLGGTGGQ
jgi:hypothetical protein